MWLIRAMKRSIVGRIFTRYDFFKMKWILELVYRVGINIYPILVSKNVRLQGLALQPL